MQVNDRLPHTQILRSNVGWVADERTKQSHNGKSSHKTEVGAGEEIQADGINRGCSKLTSVLAEPRVQAVVCVFGVFSVSGASFVVLIAKAVSCVFPWYSAGSPIVVASQSMPELNFYLGVQAFVSLHTVQIVVANINTTAFLVLRSIRKRLDI